MYELATLIITSVRPTIKYNMYNLKTCITLKIL